MPCEPSADAESKRAGLVDNDGDPFVHACYCGKWGFFGDDVMLMKGQTGTWFRAEHRPHAEAGFDPSPESYSRRE